LQDELSTAYDTLFQAMTYQVLARKWRPHQFEELIGQEHVSRALVNGLDQDRLHHAFLFTGTRGIGKTTIARILAKCLNCETGVSSRPCGECASCVDVDEGRFVDMIEIDAASRTGVDDMRDLLDSVQYMPTRGRFKVYIIDEVHMLSASSFNALLKTLEEPPPHVKFVLATTDPEKIPVTILSRCLRFNLRRLAPEQIQAALSAICESEGIEAEPLALERISRAADGSMRDGLSLLDQATAYGGGKLVQDDVERMLGLVEHRHIAALLTALAQGDAAGVLEMVGELHAQSCEPATVLADLAEVLHRVCILHCVPDYRDRDRSDWDSIESVAQALSKEAAQLFYQIAIKGSGDLGLAPDPRTGLEMTLLRMLAFDPAKSISAATGGAPAAVAKKPQRPEKSAEPAPQAASAQTSDAAVPSRQPASPPKPAKTEVLQETKPERGRRKTTSAPTHDDGWVSMVGDLPISGQVRELARNLHLRSREGEKWSFAIAPSLRHLGSKQCVDSLGRAISEQLGEVVQISLSDEAEGELLTAAGISRQGQRRKQNDAERAIEDDPTVQALKEKLGATIVEDSIQALQ
jgi:DNA polymerase-3 subunit gamma/tau